MGKRASPQLSTRKKLKQWLQCTWIIKCRSGLVKVIYLKCRSSDTFSLPGNFTLTLEISLIDSEEEATSITPANGELSICFSLIFLHVNNTLFASTSHFHKQFVLHSVIFYFFFWCLGFWNSRVIARITRLTLMGSSVLDCTKPALQIQSLEQIHFSALLCGRYENISYS